MTGRALMIQGTASHVGKSVLTAAFCRLLRRRGVQVAPFKAMNMSNNAWVAGDGGEMATAQAVQARAAGVEPAPAMNPVLLKTLSDSSCQLIVRGRPVATVAASRLGEWRDPLLKAIHGSLAELAQAHEFLVIEGAGSPSEVNLRRTDLANMEVALALGCPVILVADIERGGVFAQIIGTLELLPPEERSLVRGFIINKFRGDPALLAPGLRWLEERTGLPVFGVLPFFPHLRIPEEDGLGIEEAVRPELVEGRTTDSSLRIQVIRFPTISNFTDFDPLKDEAGVRLEYLAAPPPEGTPLPHLLILPGSKSTMADLAWLRREGWEEYLRRCRGAGVEVLGVCGGFQMLGERILDPSHVESEVSSMPGLGLLPTSTLFLPSKVTAQVRGVHLSTGAPVRGYEIHAGRLNHARRGKAVFRLQERAGRPADELDGCQAGEPPVWGTYLHGLFDEDAFRASYLSALRKRCGLSPAARGHERVRVPADPFDELADAVEAHLQVDRILQMVPGQNDVKLAEWTLSR